MTTNTSLAAVYAQRDAQTANAPQGETNRFISILKEQFTPTRGGLILNGTLSVIALMLGLTILSVQSTDTITTTTEAPAAYTHTDELFGGNTEGKILVGYAAEEGGI